MICCEECFNDFEVKASIASLNHKGNCPLCGAKNIWIYDSDQDFWNSQFEELLTSIIEIYKPEDELDLDFPEGDKQSLEKHLANDWEIFRVDLTGIRAILEGIVENSIDLDERILDQRVGIPELYDEVYLDQKSIFGKYQWEDFKSCLRNENRFHSKYINLRIFAEVLKDTSVSIKKGIRLYRARIAEDKKGYSKGKMWAPPKDVASAGRANSKGISCLYLASEKKTAVKEIRAAAFDYVTIATFKLIENINVVDLSVITHNSPFYAKTNKIDYLINEKHLREIAKDLSKPVSKRDSDLDYLPTQYISDFAKFLGYDGVKYISTFDKRYYNLALFDIQKCDCVYKRNYAIDFLEYKLRPL